MNMPISVRGGDHAHNFDNQFVPARMVLPLRRRPAPSASRGAATAARVRAEPALPTSTTSPG
jgi:hypothetical protein